MQLPSVDRQPVSRPAGADLVSANGQRVIPVPPVNPSIAVHRPGVVNKIGDGASLAHENPVYQSVSDPARPGSEAATSPKDWTIKRPEQPEQTEPAPREPVYKMLLEFLQSMWRASGSAIEIAQTHNQSPQVNPNAAAGTLAREDLTYSPSKIRKTTGPD